MNLHHKIYELPDESYYCAQRGRPKNSSRQHSSLSPYAARVGQNIDTVFGFVFAREYPALLHHISEFLTPPEASYFAGLQFLRRQQSFLLGRYAAKLASQYALQEPDLKAIEISRGVFEQPLVTHLSAKTPGVTISHCNEIAVALAFPTGQRQCPLSFR